MIFSDFCMYMGETGPENCLLENFLLGDNLRGHFGPPFQATRADLVDLLEQGFTVEVARERLHRHMLLFLRIELVSVDGQAYLRTDGKTIPADYIEGISACASRVVAQPARQEHYHPWTSLEDLFEQEA